MNIERIELEGVGNTHRLNIGRIGLWALPNEVKDIQAPHKIRLIAFQTQDLSVSHEKLCCISE
jgi:hypothetical protein